MRERLPRRTGWARVLQPPVVIEARHLGGEYHDRLHWSQLSLLPLVATVWWWAWQRSADGWQAAEAVQAHRVMLDPPWAVHARSGFGEVLTEIALWSGSDAIAGLVGGVSVGVVDLVPRELNEQMRTSGLAHITAVSGANVIVIVSILLMLVTMLGLPRWPRRIVEFVGIWGFVCLVGGEVTVVRAAAMLTIVVALRGSARVRGLPAIGLATIALLLIEPALARDMGFSLSVSATAGLVAFGPACTAVLARWMPVALASIGGPTLAALISCQPVLRLLDPSPAGLHQFWANLLVAPAVAPVTVLGVLACLLSPLSSWASAFLAVLALPGAWWIEQVAAYFAEHPIGVLPWPEGEWGRWTSLVVIAGMLLARCGLPVMPRLPVRRAVRLITAITVGFVVSAVFVTTAGRLAVLTAMPANPSVVQCDVGQGDALLLRDRGATMLIDTGDDPEAVLSCLRATGASRLDVLALTHADADHVGAAARVARTIEVVTVLVPDVQDPRMTEVVNAMDAASTVRGHRDQRGQIGSLAWRVLSPTSGSREIDASEANDLSLVLLVDVGGLRVLATGDVGQEPQERVVRDLESMGLAGAAAAGQQHPIDVVKVAHHGSANHASRLYDAVKPRLALISVGAGNRYGHPAPSLLHSLRQTQTPTARTDRCGMIAVSREAKGGGGGSGGSGGLSLWSERGCAIAAP